MNASTLRGRRADLRRDPEQVREMFDIVARGYDRTNVALSLGQVFRWRGAVVEALAPSAGQRILDVAAGTGRSSVPLLRSGAEVTAADFSPGMIAEGKRRFGGLPHLRLVEADATALPFNDGQFDSVTISFSLRNTAQPALVLQEMRRVTVPGGRLVICEFSHPPSPLIRALYTLYRAVAFPFIALLTSSNPTAYDYLRESIDDWPDQQTLASWLRSAGWARVEYRNLSGGVVALHRATNPTDEQLVRDGRPPAPAGDAERPGLTPRP